MRSVYSCLLTSTSLGSSMIKNLLHPTPPILCYSTVPTQWQMQLIMIAVPRFLELYRLLQSTPDRTKRGTSSSLSIIRIQNIPASQTLTFLILSCFHTRDDRNHLIMDFEIFRGRREDIRAPIVPTVPVRRSLLSPQNVMMLFMPWLREFNVEPSRSIGPFDVAVLERVAPSRPTPFPLLRSSYEHRDSGAIAHLASLGIGADVSEPHPRRTLVVTPTYSYAPERRIGTLDYEFHSVCWISGFCFASLRSGRYIYI
ncbi:hypothetical protein DFS33DRAFT_119860 [Desarmillaria ectypa]|nr:hypothetical protein DFS33DRAFT_119860 [Desarmillaria ectypa]